MLPKSYPKHCKHLRVRDTNDYTFDVEKFLQSIEKEYQIDFRTFPGWKDLVQRLHVTRTDLKRRIEDAFLRKHLIIDKLHMQMTRPSPFELTDALCRTAKKWSEKKKTSELISIPEMDENTKKITRPREEQIETESPHPNTEIQGTSSSNASSIPQPVPAVTESFVETTHLPYYICTNPHKMITPLGTGYTGYSYHTNIEVAEKASDDEREDWMDLKPTSLVECDPKVVIIIDSSLKEQTVKFLVTNCTTEYLHIRFITVIDSSPFKRTKLLPLIPKKIYPGITVVYKFIFKLKTQKNFTTSLYFKVGRGVFINAPPEGFYVPVRSEFTAQRSVTVSDPVFIPPVYLWHLKRNSMYSTGTVKVSVNDPYTYHLHIHKRIVDLSIDPQDSAKAQEQTTERKSSSFNDDDMKTFASLKSSKTDQKLKENEIKSQAPSKDVKETSKKSSVTTNKDVKTSVSQSKEISKPGSSTIKELIKTTSPDREVLQSVSNFYAIVSLAEEIIELALQSFIFESTYLLLQPHSKENIPVYLTKAEHAGYHQSYYDFEFFDSKTGNLVFTKTSRVFAEIIPHPIQVSPVILDMSKSSVTHGYSEESFVITNSHKLYPVTVRIKLTTKMKKMFYVEPMVTLIPTSSSVTFCVKFCSRDFKAVHPSEDLVHFTFKIVITGYKPVYENVPPIFYEVIAPCAEEFKMVYNEKYFKES